MVPKCFDRICQTEFLAIKMFKIPVIIWLRVRFREHCFRVTKYEWNFKRHLESKWYLVEL